MGVRKADGWGNVGTLGVGPPRRVNCGDFSDDEPVCASNGVGCSVGWAA